MGDKLVQFIYFIDIRFFFSGIFCHNHLNCSSWFSTTNWLFFNWSTFFPCIFLGVVDPRDSLRCYLFFFDFLLQSLLELEEEELLEKVEVELLFLFCFLIFTFQVLFLPLSTVTNSSDWLAPYYHYFPYYFDHSFWVIRDFCPFTWQESKEHGRAKSLKCLGNRVALLVKM